MNTQNEKNSKEQKDQKIKNSAKKLSKHSKLSAALRKNIARRKLASQTVLNKLPKVDESQKKLA